MCGMRVCVVGGLCGRGHVQQGACMAGVCVVGGMHGRGHAWPWQGRGNAYEGEGGMHGSSVHGRGVCVVGDMHGSGACVARGHA